MKAILISACTYTIPQFREDLIKDWIACGATVVVFGDEPLEKWKSYFESLGAEYRQYRVSRNGLNPVDDIHTLNDLRHMLAEERPDVLLTYQAKANIYGCLAAAAEGVDGVYVLMGGLGSIFRGSSIKQRFVKTVLSREYKLAFRKARAVFLQNRDDASVLLKHRIVNEKQVVMINGSGVNLDSFSFSEPHVFNSFLFVGRLIKDKGLLDYLEAAKLVKKDYPECEFHVVGGLDDNPTSLTREELKSYIDEGVAYFHGRQEEMASYYRNSSVFVLPSYHEGTPKAALEAMATGRPVVVTDVPGCREVVEDGLNGFLVPAKSPTKLALALEAFLETPDLVAAMGRQSRRIAEEKFDVHDVNRIILHHMGIPLSHGETR